MSVENEFLYDIIHRADCTVEEARQAIVEILNTRYAARHEIVYEALQGWLWWTMEIGRHDDGSAG